jgi:hypothetical protein
MLLSFFFVLQIPLLFGLLVGLLVLDERDDDTLTALRVTPDLHDWLRPLPGRGGHIT